MVSIIINCLGKYDISVINAALAVKDSEVIAVVSEEGASLPCRTVLCRPHAGRAAALNAGFAVSTGDKIVYQEAVVLKKSDYDALLSSDVPAVFGAGSGKNIGIDRLLSFASTVLTQIKTTALRHPCCMFRREVLEKLTFTEKGSGFSAEIAAKLSDNGIKAAEITVSAPRKPLMNPLRALYSILVNCPLFTYGMVGLISTLVEWGIFWILDHVTSASVYLSTAVAFILSTVVNWYLGRTWTFKEHSGSFKDVLPVCIVSVIGLALSEAIMSLFIDLMEMPNFLSKVLTTMLVFFWNYLARKKLVYKNK